MSPVHPRYRVGFMMEQALGHITHHRALEAQVAADASLRATWITLPHQADDTWQRLPGFSRQMSLLLSLRARSGLRAHGRAEDRFDGLFFHTQVSALLAHRLMRRIPTVLSLDATPLNADPSPPAQPNSFTRRPSGEHPLERAKYAWTRRTFDLAAGLVAWSEWARRSLLSDYGIPDHKIAVIPPGVDLVAWQPNPQPRVGKPRILFVGAHFERKGGQMLLEAVKGLGRRADLHLVTPERSVASDPGRGIHVHHEMRINSPALRDLYAQASLFVLPSLNDCMPMAVLEAMASGLPVIASDVGAVREQVKDGVTGLLVRPGDPGALTGAINALLDNPPRCRAMGIAGRQRAEERFSARSNYPRVLGLIKRCIDESRAGRARAAGRFDASDEDLDLQPAHHAWPSEC